MSAPLPANEDTRLIALHECRILDTLSEQSFDDVTLLAAQICDVPLSGVSLVDKERQWFKSKVGLELSESPRDVSFCAHTILQPDLMLVPDAQSDPRFSENPLVTGDPGIRFYAGMPLITQAGFALGSLCVLDKKPRQLSTSQQTALRALGNQVAGQLELKRYLTVQQQLMAEREVTERKLQSEIAERRWAETELHQTLTQSAQVLASITSILIGVDADGMVTTWNNAAGAAFGLERATVLEQRFRDCAIQWSWDSILEAVQECVTEQKPVRLADMRYLTAAGKEGCLGVTLTPLRSYTEEPQGFLLLAADVTGQRVLERQLSHAQKLESIGQMAAGIAHEINTPIQYVGDNLRFLLEAFDSRQSVLAAYKEAVGTMDPAAQAAIRQAEDDADAQYLAAEIPSAIQQAIGGIERVAHIVHAMKEFSHPGTAHKVATDLNKALDSTITVARNEWRYVAEVVMEFDPDLPLVPCLPADLNQVFLNLLVNAAHAIADRVAEGEKGTIIVSTHACGQHVEVHIQDTGTGMTEEVKSHIFDPFFTTKPVGRGTGQGLAISHGVITGKHGGTITVESTPGEGSTFTIRLPLSPEEIQENDQGR